MAAAKTRASEMDTAEPLSLADLKKLHIVDSMVLDASLLGKYVPTY